MTARSRKEYMDIMRARYQEADREERSELLDEVCQTCGYARKYAITLLNQPVGYRRPSRRTSDRPRGRPKVYNDPVMHTFLVKLWKKGNLPCGKRLRCMIPLWLPHYRLPDGDPLPEKTQALLRSISPASIDRYLASQRVGRGKLGLATTKPSSILRSKIPIRRSEWREDRPGFFETDTVAHCGTSVSGTFAYTMNLVDIATGWTEQWALWERGQHGIITGLKRIEAELPFPLLGLDSDNGTEFINWQLYQYLDKRHRKVLFTRGRPDHSNDNAHVEQKNWSIIRQYLGYDRFDNHTVVAPMNALYRGPLRLLINFFMPSMQQIHKERVGEKIIRRHDGPHTPFQRLLRTPGISEKKKRALTEQFKTLDPFTLADQVQEYVRKIQVTAHCGDPDCPYHQ